MGNSESGAPPIKTETLVHRICRFGVYEADFGAGTLKRHGIPLRVQEQPFRILSLLLERPGQVVSRDELRSRLWPEGTFVEFDGSLNTALMKLRAVLNDDPNNPRFVETVPKKGYRFIAPVQVPESASAAISVEMVTIPIAAQAMASGDGRGGDDIAAATSATSRRAALINGALLGAGVLTAAILWAYWPAADPQVLKVTQLTYSGRIDPASEVVSDGARLYFVSREGGQQVLMTTSVHGGSVERLASPFNNTMIFDSSPDRTQLLLASAGDLGDPVPLWIWPAHGGVPHRLGDALATDAAWSPKGDMIAYTQDDRLFTIGRDGSSPHELHKLSGFLHSPAWSGDGQKIRFTLSDREKSTDELWETAADGSGLRQILLHSPSDLHVATGIWNLDQRYFLFTAGSDSSLDPVTHSASNLWISREGGRWYSRRRKPIQLTQGPVAFGYLTGSIDTSDRYFALGSHPELQLFHIDPRSSRMNVILPDAGVSDVDVSADGEWLVYSLREGGALWKSRRDGKERTELTASSPGSQAPQWSPDKKEILFTAYFLAKQPQLYVVPSAGGTPRPLLPESFGGSARSGDWSSDGTQILFDHFEHGASDVRILERASGRVETLPDSAGLVQPRWSPDGKHIAVIKSKSHSILVYALDARKWSLLAETAEPRGMRWSADSNFVYYQEMADAEQSVLRIRLGKGTPEKIFGFADLLGSMSSQCRFAGVAPDGSIYATVDRGGVDLYSLDLMLP